MADLKAIQKTLDTDENEKKAFLKSPITYLEKQGVPLNAKDKEHLHNIIEKNSNLLNSAVSVGVTVGT